MPQDIEGQFKEVGVSLFPTKLGDLKTDCSCPDWSNPCKHIAATYYLLGEEFDRDPFLIFALRGLSRDALLSELGRLTPGGGRARVAPEAPPRSHEPLSAQVETFWGESGGRIEDPFGAVEIPREPAALPRRLGGFPFWRGESPFLDTLSLVYAAASPRGLDVLLRPVIQGDRSEAE
jgi:uncharacterized Zn finger protein